MTTKQFNKLGKAEQRVLIAQDVLANIKSKVYIPKEGVYFDDSLLIRELGSNADIQQNFDKIKECEVCAMGSCLLSTIKFKDSITTTDLKDMPLHRTSKESDLIVEVFSENQLALIETAFERRYSTEGHWSSVIGGVLTTIKEVNKAIKFGMKYANDTNKLIGIMKNIIKNNGTFIP